MWSKTHIEEKIMKNEDEFLSYFWIYIFINMIRISFTGLVFEEKGMYVAYCPELDVSSCGYKIDEARKNLREAVDILLDETERMGTL